MRHIKGTLIGLALLTIIAAPFAISYLLFGPCGPPFCFLFIAILSIAWFFGLYIMEEKQW
jgi:hypothetical protein